MLSLGVERFREGRAFRVGAGGRSGNVCRRLAERANEATLYEWLCRVPHFIITLTGLMVQDKRMSEFTTQHRFREADMENKLKEVAQK